jgi:MFS family permease
VVLFGLFGTLQTSWMGRLPSVRESLDLTAGQLGSLLVVGAVGSLVGVTMVGTVIIRFGSRATLVLGMAGSMVGFALIGMAVLVGSTPLFATGLLVNGLVVASTNVPINLEAARVEKLLGRSILPHVHASFSIGALLGAVIAAGTSTFGIPVAWHIVGVAVVVTAARVVLIGPSTELADPPARRGAAASSSTPGGTTTGTTTGTTARRGARGGALRAWTEPRTLMIGLVLLAASMSEGAAANWLNLGVVDGFATREAVGAAAYGTFVVAMLSVRLTGPILIERLGRVTVLRASGVSALLGLLAFGLAPSLPLAWAGIVLWGIGAALAWPVGTSAAADDPTKAAARVSVVNSFGSIASISMPPVLGLLADSWGVRHALLVITAAMVVSLAVAGKVRPEPVHEPVHEADADASVTTQDSGQHVDDADVAVEPRDVEEVAAA